MGAELVIYLHRLDVITTNTIMNKRNFKRRPKRSGRGARAPGNTASISGRTIALLLKNNRRVTRIPRNIFSPDSVLCDLTYPDTVITHTNTTFNFLSWRYRMSSIWDPDPTLGSGSVPGQSFYAAGYNAYRVLGISYSIDLSNLESSPVDVVVAPSLVDLGANYASTNELFAQPYAAVALLSAKGGQDRTRLKGTIDLGQFWGNSTDLLSDANFGSPINGNPAQILFLNIGGTSASQFTVGNGLDYRLTLVYHTLIYQRKILIS